MSETDTPGDPHALTAEEAVLDLLARRGPGKTICPSEAARELAGSEGDWRSKMEEIHEVVDGLLETDRVRISWKGVELDQRRGPYRIARR